MRRLLLLLALPSALAAQGLDEDLYRTSMVTSLTSSDGVIETRNAEARLAAKDPGHFKFVVDKDRSLMAVFDRTEKIGVFPVRLGTNTREDGYGRFVDGKSPRNTPIGVFRTGAGRASVDGFTWFIPYEVPGRSAMGIHGPKNTFLGYFYSFVHWTRGCIALTSKTDILVLKDAHRRARARDTPVRVIIGRGIDFATIPGGVSSPW